MSHLLPKAMYKTLRSTSGRQNPHPILFRRGFAIQTARQAQAYLLCEECEERFHLRGEKWVLANCYRTGGTFLLREMLENAAPLSNNGDIRVYSAAVVRYIDADAITYFALSVFWRAAVHRWPLEGRTIGIDLGPYEGTFRRFLLGEASFPDSVCLSVLVGVEGRMVELAINPVSGNENGFHQHKFTISGLTFLLFVGARLPIEYVTTSFSPAPERYISIYPKGEQRQLVELFNLYRRARHGSIRDGAIARD
jgi:hypothetical protein